MIAWEESMNTVEPARKQPGGVVDIYRMVVRTLAGLMMSAIFCVMIAQVIARYVFGSSLIWAEEFCRYVLVWMTFLLLGLSYQAGEFVSLEMLPGALPEVPRQIVHIVMAIPTLIFLALVTWAGWEYAGRFEHQTIPALDFIWTSITGHALHLSIRWVYISVSVGSALLFLHILVDLVLRAGRLFRGEPETIEMKPDSGENV